MRLKCQNKRLYACLLSLCILIYATVGSSEQYSDAAQLPELFALLFPEDTYEDGYIQEDGTLTFLARKANSELVLYCGAFENDIGWEWTETVCPER